MNAPVPVQVSMPSLAMNEGELIAVLSNSLYPGAKPESIKLVLSYCKAAGLDPLQKPVHIVPMSVKIAKTGEYEWRDVVMPGIELYRVKASRTGEHAGTSEPEFGPDKELKVGDFSITYPEWCRVTVRRLVAGREVEFTAIEYWEENYATKGKDSKIPNAMWQKRKRGQIAKCSEAQALRKAFPELGAQPTAEEMEGKIIDADPIPQEPARIEKPRAKLKTAPQDNTPPESAAPAAQPPSSASPSDNGSGAAPDPNAPKLSEGQQRILRARLESAGMDEQKIVAKFGGALPDLPSAMFNDVASFVREAAQA